MNRVAAVAVAWLALSCAFGPVAAAGEVPSALADGLRAFQEGFYDRAVAFFGEAAADTSHAYAGHARFWMGRTYMALARYDRAADSFDLFLGEFRDHPYREEARYQQARLFHLSGDYETAIQSFAAFIADYPLSDFRANALYWSGESLLGLGRLNAAAGLFAEVVERFPTSFRVEAARYRLDVIGLRERELELLRLLQWSHEEYLVALEGFRRKEAAYQEALRSYRARLTGLADDDFRSEIALLNARIDELEGELAVRESRINELLAQLRQAQAASPPSRPAAETAAETAAPSGPLPTPAAPVEAPPADTPPPAADSELLNSLARLRAEALELQELLRAEQQGEGR